MSKKRMDLLRKFIEDEGLTFDCFVDKHDSRINARAIGHDGSTRLFSLSAGQGDHRGDQNEHSRIRRYAREIGQPPLLAMKLKPVVEEFKKVAALQPKTIEQARIMDAMDKLPRGGMSDEQTPVTDEDPWLKAITTRVEQAKQLKAPTSPTAGLFGSRWLEGTGIKLDPGPARKPSNTLSKRIITMADTKPTDTRKLARKLTMAESHKLFEWLRTIDTTTFTLTSQVASEANAKAGLGVLVSDTTVNEAMKVLGLKMKDRRSEAKRGYTQAAPIIARALVQLMDKMGEPVPDELREISKRSTS